MNMADHESDDEIVDQPHSTSSGLDRVPLQSALATQQRMGPTQVADDAEASLRDATVLNNPLAFTSTKEEFNLLSTIIHTPPEAQDLSRSVRYILYLLSGSMSPEVSSLDNHVSVMQTTR
jgi:hypothetical protein